MCRIWDSKTISLIKNGYGRNFLIPQGLAILTTDLQKILNENIKQREFKEKKVIEDATNLKKNFKLDIKIPAKLEKQVNFGSI